MKKYIYKNQTGFSHIELFLAVLFIGVIAFVGDRVLTRSDAAATCTVNAILVNSCRPLFGVAANGNPGAANDLNAQFSYVEKLVGRPLDVFRSYTTGTQPLTSTEVSFANRANTYIDVNWKPAGNWASADGSDQSVNSTIKTVADSIKKVAPHKVMLTVWHEPQNHVSPGTSSCPGLKGSAGSPAQYVAMWQNVEKIFKAEGVTNVVWVMNYQGDPKWECLVKPLWPGNSLVDWVHYDSYDRSTSATYDNTVGNFYNWLSQNSTATYNFNSKPWGLGEFGVCQNPSSTNADQYYVDAKNDFLAGKYPNLKMYLAYDDAGGPAAGLGCLSNHNNSGAVDNTRQQDFNALVNAIMNVSSPTPPPAVKPPVISSFTASPTAVKVGQTSKLSWVTSNVKNCSVSSGGPQNTTATSWTTPAFTSASTSTYTLTCQNSSGTKVSKSVAVTSSISGVGSLLCESTAAVCISLPAGGKAFGTEAVTVIAKANAWGWDETTVGTVTTSYPFSVSLLAHNTTYAGENVVQYHLHANPSYCLADSGTAVQLQTCANNPAQLWVVNGVRRINAAASDSNSARYALTNVSGLAKDTPAGDSSATNQDWVLGDLDTVTLGPTNIRASS